MSAILEEILPDVVVPAAKAAPAQRSVGRPPILPAWLKSQALNVTRHAAGLRPFTRDEFGTGAASPTEGHLQAANELITKLRRQLLNMSHHVTAAAHQAVAAPTPAAVTHLITDKDRAHNWVQLIEQIWDFYFELFGQRQSRFGDWLLSCDRIATDCYQYVYLGINTARSVPAPPPFAYMRTGFSPATFRRAVPLKRLGKQLNPFPLVQLPYHRLMNPWTLGAILHEVSHNLQNDLALEKIVPDTVERRLRGHGLPPFVARAWKRWNREMFADMSGLLLGGPPVVASLMDVVGRSRPNTLTFRDGAPHPTPYFRTLISCELLKRMGFPSEAAEYRKAWAQLYPHPEQGDIPKVMMQTFPDANAVAVDAMCFTRFPQLGDRSLAEVIRFAPKEMAMIEEAARRLAVGTDPGIVPERFLIGAARVALDRGLARPGVITKNFYGELSRR